MQNRIPLDIEIKNCYQKDRKEGFRLIYLKYADKLYTICRRYSGNKESAMDSFQECMMKIDKTINRFRYQGEGSLFRWMWSVSVNMITDKIRKSKPVEIVEINDDIAPIEGIYPDFQEIIPLEKLMDLIETLTPMRRTVLNLHIDGYTYREIGEMLGITEYGASSTMSKARKELSKKIEDYYKKHE